MSSQRLLLDVNVWIALLDDQHVHNRLAQALVDRENLQIASCAITENGVFRVIGNIARIQQRSAPYEKIREMMSLFCEDHDHEFWFDDLSLRDPKVLNFDRIAGHNQITDAYLLALAVKHKGALATLDHRVALSSVHGAKPEHLVLI